MAGAVDRTDQDRLKSVSWWTRPSGRADTQWPGLAQKPKKYRLLKMLVASVVVHAFLTPGPALLGLMAMLPAIDLSDSKGLPEEPLKTIPVDLVAQEPAEPVKEEKKEPEAEPQEPPEEKGSDPSPPSEPEPVSEEPKEKSVPAPKKPTPEAENPDQIGDPVSLAGAAGELADSDANVRMLLHTEVVREHPLGERVGNLLRRTPQWRDFFGPARIDPIEDIDRVLVAGPQFRDSSNVVAVVQHRLKQRQIERALDRLVERHGEWLDEDARLAKARADRATRIFSAPASDIVAVAPESALESVKKLGKKTRFPRGQEHVAVQAYVVTPWRAFKGTGIRIPKSIEWVRMEVRPQSSGGATLRLMAQDGSDQQARRNAQMLERMIRQAVEIDFGRMGALGSLASLAFGGRDQKMLEAVEFRSEGDRIFGALTATEKQLENLMDLLDAFLPPEPGSKSGRKSSAERERRAPRQLEPKRPDADPSAVDSSDEAPEDKPSGEAAAGTGPEAEDGATSETEAAPEEGASPDKAP